MKFMLSEKDYLEKDHLYELIIRFAEDNNGRKPEIVIVHPETYHKIIMCTNERNDDFAFSVFQVGYKMEKPVTTIYGIAFIRSFDIERDFIWIV